MTNKNQTEDVVKFYVLKIKECVHYDYDGYDFVHPVLKDHQPISLPSKQYSELCFTINELNSRRYSKSKNNQYFYQVVHVIDEDEYKHSSLFEEILALQEEMQKQKELEKLKREQVAAKRAINKEKQLQKQIEKARLDLEKLQQQKVKASK